MKEASYHYMLAKTDGVNFASLLLIKFVTWYLPVVLSLILCLYTPIHCHLMYNSFAL